MSQFYDQASLVMVPSGYKAGKVYSQKPLSTDGELTFTRNSNATRVNSAGKVEKVRENNALNSDFASGWTLTNATNSTSATANPVNGLTAQDIIPNTALSAHRILRTAGFDNSVNTWSVYAKAKGYNYIALVENGNTGANVSFNLSTGAVGTQNSAVGQIESLGNGWYRCSMIHTTTTTPRFDVYIMPTDSLSAYSGDGTSGVTLFGAQAEVSDFGPTQYIPTTSAAVSVGPTANVPRLDYSGGCPSLLLEPQRTNVALFSEQFDNAAWLKLGITVSANNTISPSGYVDADKLIADAGTGNRVVYQSVVPVGVSTVSTYAKAGEFGGIVIANGTQGAFFNVITGAYRAFYVSAPTAYSITSVGNGWYRCSVTFTSASTDNWYIGPNDNFSNTLAITGNGTDGIYAWGAQLEASASYASSYIGPTLGASVTRLADTTYLQNMSTGVASGATAGTLFLELEYIHESLNDAFSFGQDNNFYPAGRGYIYNGGSGFADSFAGGGFTIPQGENVKMIYRLNSLSNVNIFQNGVKGATRTGTAWAAINQIIFRGSYASFKIKQILFTKTALTDAECIELTTL